MSLINYVKGQITYRNPAHIIIEANGVGYGLLVSLNTFSKLSFVTRFKLSNQYVGV